LKKKKSFINAKEKFKREAQKGKESKTRLQSENSSIKQGQKMKPKVSK